MAASILDTTRNFVCIATCRNAPRTCDVSNKMLTQLPQSLYTIPAAWVLSIAPHFYAASLGKFDNKQPRTYTREIDGDQSVDKGNISRLTSLLFQFY
jgi:hypothetical protein